MFRRCANDLQSNTHRRARNWVKRGAFIAHLLIQTIQYWSCPVHASDVDPSTFPFIGQMIEPVESRVLTGMDAMDPIVLITCISCCTIQLLWHMLCHPHLPHQLPAYAPTSVLDPGVQVRSGFWGSAVSSSRASSGDGAPGTLCMGRWISWLCSSIAIQVHRLKSHHDGSGRSQPAGGQIPSGNSRSFMDIGWYCW